MENLVLEINSLNQKKNRVKWNDYEKYLNHFDESCMDSELFFNTCEKISEKIRNNHRDMYKDSAMQCVRDVANCKKEISIKDFCKISEEGCIVNILKYFQNHLLNDSLSDFEKGVYAYFGIMLAYITSEQAIHIIPDTFFGGKLFLDESLCEDLTVDDPELEFFDLSSTGFFFNMMKVCFLSCFKPKVFNHIQKKGNRISRIHPFLPNKETLLKSANIPDNFDLNEYISPEIRQKGLTLKMLDRENPKIMSYKYKFNNTDEAIINLFFMFYNNFDYLSVTIPWRKDLLTRVMPKIMRHV